MKTKILALWLLFSGCAYNPVIPIYGPYTKDQLEQVKPRLQEVYELSWFELQKQCGNRPVLGCINLTTEVIYILEDLPEVKKEQVLHHEYSHAYEVYILGLPAKMSQQHIGWPTYLN